MRRILSILAGIAALSALEGCDSLKPDKTALLAPAASAAEPMRCDLCHGNPPNSGFHKYHIDTVGMKGFMNAPGVPVISCVTCHAASIEHASGAMVLDSSFVDSNNTTYHTSGWPWKPFERTADRQFYGTYDSMIDPPVGSFMAPEGLIHPDWAVVAAAHPDLPGHMNGRVDIQLQRGVDWSEDQYVTASDGSDSLAGTVVHAATWKPLRMSCGMVACHQHDNGKDSDTSNFYVWTKGKRTGK